MRRKAGTPTIGSRAAGHGATPRHFARSAAARISASVGVRATVGLLPAIHFAHLPRIVGRHRAYEFLFTGRAFGAEEARALGRISRIAVDARAETLVLARTFAAKSPTAMALGRAEF